MSYPENIIIYIAIKVFKKTNFKMVGNEKIKNANKKYIYNIYEGCSGSSENFLYLLYFLFLIRNIWHILRFAYHRTTPKN